ncbi:MAG: TonB-dependent receptor [Paludibacter sp.]|nr:TonB-dependent receptor [Paludibacter sp.]
MKTKIVLVIFSICVCQLFSQTKINKTDSISKVYTLGEVAVSGLRQSSKFQQIGAAQMQQFNREDLASALKLLPGVNITNVGGRNEAMVYLRGFDLRQVPIFADGVPIYVPFDGYIDLTRFTTYDLSKISISKGFTSILYGSNTLGGAVNLISRKPNKALEADIEAGMKLSSAGFNGYHTALNIGTKQKLFYALGSFSILDKKFMSLSDDFTAVKGENGGKRDHSESRDFKASAKVGYTPNATDEYSLNYTIQRANKGVPTYCGINPTQGYRYWEYPEWNKSSIYFISKTVLTPKTYLKTNAFYDKYYNSLSAFDDSTYTSQKKGSSFNSEYDDYTTGGSLELSTEAIQSNTLKFAFHEKYDVHREHNTGEKIRTFADNTLSIGAEDTYKINDKINAIAGFSYNRRASIEAQNYFSTKDSIADFPSNTGNAINYQLGGIYNITSNQQLTLSASHKTRFPTLKDRYSYKMGKAIPNPDLTAESGWNFELNYAATLSNKLQVEGAVFYNRLKNAIQQVDNVEPGKYQMQNVGNATFKGFELQAGWAPTKELTSGVTYSYIDRENTSKPSVKFTDVPKHKVFGFLQYNLAKKDAYLQMNGEYNSKRISTSDGKYTAGEYFLLNTKIHTAVYKGLSVEAAVNNLFDKNYCVVEGYPEEGRTLLFTLKYKL